MDQHGWTPACQGWHTLACAQVHDNNFEQLVLATYVNIGVRSKFSMTGRGLRYMREVAARYQQLAPAVQAAIGFGVNLLPIP